MVLEILGNGCAKCGRLHKLTLEALTESGTSAEVRKIEDVAAILERGILSTPALLKDGRVLVAGRIPSVREIVAWLV